MYYLNSPKCCQLMKIYRSLDLYVDKSKLIEDVYQYAQKTNRFIAITNPRRFGKTMAATMISAFFTKGQDSFPLFSDLEISKNEYMISFMNSFNVFHLNLLSELSTAKSYGALQDLIRERMKDDLQHAFPDIEINEKDDISSILAKTGEQFFFILDEWDAVFEMDYMSDSDRMAYINFLRGLFKDQPYVHFALLTGILPIAKYSSGSPLNMFHEFNAFALKGFEQYYGFSEDEIKHLMVRKHIETPSLDEIRLWYDGYVRQADGMHIFNPDSVIKALSQGSCKNYWKGTGNMNDISRLIEVNAFSVRDDILSMIAGKQISIKLDGFGAVDNIPQTRKDILSSMVVYGFLTYSNEMLSIPNLELSQKFSNMLEKGTLGISMTLETSRKLLQSTLSEDHKAVASTVEMIHDEYIPFIHYSDENSLACVIMYGYYAASDYYEIKREQPSGKGYVDFMFHPVHPDYVPIILELKYNRSARSAIAQIRKNNYILSLKKYPKVLFVGINYSEKTKKHTCIIESTSYSKEMAAANSYS